MPSNKAPRIELSPRVQTIIEQLARQPSGEYRLVRRAQLILSMADGLPNLHLAGHYHLNRETIRYWRARWLELVPRLEEAAAAQVSELELRDLIVAGLSDRERCGTPITFSAEQVAQILALACESPETCGLPLSHWTPEQLAAEVVRRTIVTSIAPSSIRRFLKSSRPQTAPPGILAQPHTG